MTFQITAATILNWSDESATVTTFVDVVDNIPKALDEGGRSEPEDYPSEDELSGLRKVAESIDSYLREAGVVFDYAQSADRQTVNQLAGGLVMAGSKVHYVAQRGAENAA